MMSPTGVRVQQRNWWMHHFDTVYMQSWEQLRSDCEVAEECEVIRMLLARFGVEQGRLLDAPCGCGRHAITLARHGYAVEAIDRSAEMVAAAQARTATEGEDLAVDFRRADLRTLRGPADIGGAYNWYTSLGYTLHPGDDVRVLAALCTRLVPGGVLLLESDHLAHLRHDFVPEYDVAAGSGVRIRGRRELAANGVFTDVQEIELDGVRHERRAQVLIYAIEELVHLCAHAGLLVAAVLDSNGTAPANDLDRVIVACRKPG